MFLSFSASVCRMWNRTHVNFGQFVKLCQTLTRRRAADRAVSSRSVLILMRQHWTHTRRSKRRVWHSGAEYWAGTAAHNGENDKLNQTHRAGTEGPCLAFRLLCGSMSSKARVLPCKIKHIFPELIRRCTIAAKKYIVRRECFEARVLLIWIAHRQQEEMLLYILHCLLAPLKLCCIHGFLVG